jgi:UDP-N-acetylmuramyl pentapeptide phosphotransferase/UDP-N-acetylglucosamine-1-phosphate transferase
MDPLVREAFRWRRLLASAAIGALLAVIVIVLAGSASATVLLIVGTALAVFFALAWIASVLYLRTDRGRAARDAYLARRKESG